MKMKRLFIVCLMCVFLMGCGCYENTKLENLKTFSKITGYELVGSEVAGNYNYYYYKVPMDDKMFDKMAKWEDYLSEYGFTYIYSEDGASMYVKDGYYVCTFIDLATTENIRYVISVPNGDSPSMYNCADNSSDEMECLYIMPDGSCCEERVLFGGILCDRHLHFLVQEIIE